MSEVARAWTDLLARRDVLILDVETTGLGDSAEVVEIALLDTAGRVVYDAPIMPQGRIPKGASDIHGLTRKRLKELGARPWPEHQAAIAEALGGAVTRGIVGHLILAVCSPASRLGCADPLRGLKALTLAPRTPQLALVRQCRIIDTTPPPPMRQWDRVSRR